METTPDLRRVNTLVGTPWTIAPGQGAHAASLMEEAMSPQLVSV